MHTSVQRLPEDATVYPKTCNLSIFSVFSASGVEPDALLDKLALSNADAPSLHRFFALSVYLPGMETELVGRTGNTYPLGE